VLVVRSGERFTYRSTDWGHVFHFSPLLFKAGCPAGRPLLPLTVKASLGQGAREPSARTGPDANILPQDRYAARGRLCGLPWTPRRIPCSISIRARARTHTLASGGSCIGKLHGASRAPWRTPNGASACDCVDALATGPLAQLINERPTFSDGGSVQQGCKWSSR
jgi:hypothetical protein